MSLIYWLRSRLSLRKNASNKYPSSSFFLMTEPFWMTPQQVVLRDGTEVTLRPETDGDLEYAWEMFSSISDNTLEFLPEGFSRERVEGWFKEIDYSKAIPILGFVEMEEGTRMVSSSSLGFKKTDIYKHRATFGITVHDDYQGKGLGKLLTQYMLDIAAEQGVKKVELSVVAHNERAIHIYKKMGYEIEGLIKMEHYNPVLGQYCDAYIMGKILD